MEIARREIFETAIINIIEKQKKICTYGNSLNCNTWSSSLPTFDNSLLPFCIHFNESQQRIPICLPDGSNSSFTLRIQNTFLRQVRWHDDDMAGWIGLQFFTFWSCNIWYISFPGIWSSTAYHQWIMIIFIWNRDGGHIIAQVPLDGPVLPPCKVVKRTATASSANWAQI